MLTEDHISAEQEAIEALERRWMIGGASPLNVNQLPASWQSICESLPEEQLPRAVLALRCQQQKLLFCAKPTSTLTPQALIPALEKPVIAAQQRHLFRRCLQQAEKYHQQNTISALLALVAQRGYVAHPSDWMPSGMKDTGGQHSSFSAELAELYQPWSLWASSQTSETLTHNDDELTPANWDDWYPAPRVQALKRLRRNDAAATRELIAACVSREPADKRLRIIETLAINLSADDSDYLDSLKQDRSQKIVQLAGQLLARLGIANTEDHSEAIALARELAETFELKNSGVIKKQLKLKPRKLKSKKQQSIRTEQLSSVSLHVLAEALGITLNQLMTVWQFSENRSQDNQNFIENATQTLPTEGFDALIKNLFTYAIEDESGLFLLRHCASERLDESQRSDLYQAIIANKKMESSFDDASDFLSAPMQDLSWKTFEQSYPWRTLAAKVKIELVERGFIESHGIIRELFMLGLLIPGAMAKQVLEQLAERGLMGADPAADCLKLNAALAASS